MFSIFVSKITVTYDDIAMEYK